MAKITTLYSAEGYVLGKLWGGGFAGYLARPFRGYESLAKMEKDIKKDFLKGSLDSGMGFEKLVAAVMYVTEEKSMTVKGRLWKSHSQLDPITFGEEEMVVKLEKISVEC